MAEISIQLPTKYADANISAKIKDSSGVVQQTIVLTDRGDSFFSADISDPLDAGSYAVTFVDTDADQIVGVGELYWDGTTEISIQDLDIIRKALLNNMKVDSDNNQLVIYENDGTTELMRFNLYDLDGNPTSDNVFEIENA